MEYLFDSLYVQKLLINLELLYDSFQEISQLKYGSDYYYSCIANIRQLMINENEIILHFPKVGRVLDDINYTVRKLYAFKCEDKFKSDYVLKRFDSIVCKICAEIDSSEISSDDIYYKREYIINQINDNLICSFVMKIDNLLLRKKFEKISDMLRCIQLSTIFSSIDLSYKFVENNLDYKSLIKYSDSDIAKKNNISYEDYMFFKNEYIFDYTESLLVKIVTSFSFYENPMDEYSICGDLLLFRTLLTELNDTDFMNIRKSFFADMECVSDNCLISKISSCFNLEYKQRFSNENNIQVNSLDENTVNMLILLLKIDDSLYENFSKLSLNGLDNFEVVSNLISYEKDVASNIVLSLEDCSIVEKLIHRDLGYFIDIDNNKSKKDIIYGRIKNILSDLNKTEIADGVIEKNYSYIISNHIIDSLNKFSELVKFDDSDSVIKFYKDIIFMYPDIMNDLILLSGNYMLLSRFNDEYTSYLLNNMSLINYCTDKNEQLFKLFFKLLDEIQDINLKDENYFIYLFKFKLIQINDIINSVNDEFYNEILYEISNIKDDRIKKELSLVLKTKDVSGLT